MNEGRRLPPYVPGLSDTRRHEAIGPPPPPAVEVLAADRYPSMPERVVRVIRDLLSCIALVLLILFAFMALRVAWQIGDNLERLQPAPVVSACPFGDKECGG